MIRGQVQTIAASFSALTAKLQSALDTLDDVRSTGDYRRHVAKAIVRAFLRDLGAPV